MLGKPYLTNQKYFKPTYYEAIKYIVPQYLTEDDISTFGKEVDIKDQVILYTVLYPPFQVLLLILLSRMGLPISPQKGFKLRYFLL